MNKQKPHFMFQSMGLNEQGELGVESKKMKMISMFTYAT